LNRVILLSDGLANVGVTNSDAISSDVHSLAQRGISTTTMGVGNDYDEKLLEAMANSGDGTTTTSNHPNSCRIFSNPNCKA
jgi:Ca-activated chloride channel family protein